MAELILDGLNTVDEMFAELGVILAQHKDPSDLFWETGKALMALGDEYKQEEYAQKLFGKSWFQDFSVP